MRGITKSEDSERQESTKVRILSERSQQKLGKVRILSEREESTKGRILSERSQEK